MSYDLFTCSDRVRVLARIQKLDAQNWHVCLGIKFFKGDHNILDYHYNIYLLIEMRHFFSVYSVIGIIWR